MRTLVSPGTWKRDAPHDRPIYRVSLGAPQDVDYAPRTKRFCFSDSSVDRAGDTIAAEGWDLADFSRNPVALWCHDSGSPPIGRAWNVRVVGKRLMGDIEFADEDTYPFAETIFRLVDGKFINAVSVGFLPIKYSFVDDRARPSGVAFEEQVLLEISLCNVPMNPNALGEARAKGIDTRPLARWAADALDDCNTPMLSRAGLQQLRAAAAEPLRRGMQGRVADLAAAAAIRFRLGPDRRAADLARAAKIRRKLCDDTGPDYDAMRVAIQQQEEARRLDRAAAVDHLRAMTGW